MAKSGLSGLLVQVPELAGIALMLGGWYQNNIEVTLLGAVMFTYGIVNKTYVMVRTLYRFMLITLEAIDKFGDALAKDPDNCSIVIRGVKEAADE